MKAIINIGLISNNFDQSYVFPKGIPSKYVEQLFTADFLTPARITSSQIHQSNTEKTLVLELSVFDPERFPAFIQSIAANLEQDAIAVYVPEAGRGVLIHAENAKNNWGDFNPEYFLMPQGSYLCEPVAV